MANHPAPGNAAFAPRLASGAQWRGVPEPGVRRLRTMFVLAPILTLFFLIVLFCVMGHFRRARQFWIVGSTLVFVECAYFRFFHSAVLEYDFVIIGAVFLVFWLLTLLAFIIGVQALVRRQIAAGIVPIVLSIVYVTILYF